MKHVKTLFAAALAVSMVAHGEDAAADADALPDLPQEEKAESRSPFSLLPFCRRFEGVAEVCKPGSEWKAAEEGRFYQLGTAFRTRGAGKMTVAFGRDSYAEISGDASFSTRAQALDVKTRTLVLGEGALELTLPENMPEGLFAVAAPSFTVTSPAGVSRYVCEKTGTGLRVTVRCVTGTISVSGRHFDIPQMRAANEVVITDEHDHLATVLENSSGDYLVKLDQGVRTVSEIADDGSTVEKTVEDKAEVKFSPEMRIRITRAVPSVGERMSVFVMAFDAAGNQLGPGVSFCEGRAEVNSGTVVSQLSTAEAEGLRTAEAAAAETTEEAVADESGASSDGGEAASESTSSSGSSSDDEW